MSGFSYPPPIFLSSTYNPAFYLSLDPSGFLSYAYAQTLYVSRNDYRLSYITGITLGQGGANQALTLDGTRNVTNINSLSASSISVASLSGLSTLTLSGTLTAGTINATSGLQINGTSYDLSLLDRLNVTTIGQAQNSKALVLDANRSATNINSLTFDSGGTGIVCSTLKFWNLTGTASDTFAHTYYVGVMEGGASSSKAVVLNSTKDYSGIRNLSCSGTLTISTSISTPSITCDTITKAGTISLTPTTLNLNPTTLQIAGTALSATSTQLNYLADVTPGTAALSKALVLDGSGNIGTITSLTATSLTGTLQTSAQPNIKSLGEITSSLIIRNSITGDTLPLTSTLDDFNVMLVNQSSVDSCAAGIGFVCTGATPVYNTHTPQASIVAYKPNSNINTGLNFSFRSKPYSGMTSTSAQVERMRIDSRGRVAVGTTTALSKFTVAGDTTNLFGSWERVARFKNDNATPMAVEIIMYNEAGGSHTNGASIGTMTDDQLSFMVNGTNRVYLNDSGRMGIGSTSPEDMLHVNGGIRSTDGYYKKAAEGKAAYQFNWISTGYGGIGPNDGVTYDSRIRLGICNAEKSWSGYAAVSGGSYTNASDGRLKTDIEDLPYGLAEVLQMRPCRFKLIQDRTVNVGFIAQEMMRIIPESTMGDPNSPVDPVTGLPPNAMGIDLASLTSVLTKAIQELTARVVALEETIKNM